MDIGTLGSRCNYRVPVVFQSFRTVSHPSVGHIGHVFLVVMIDYSQKMEKTLKELRTLIQLTGGQPEHAGTPGAGPNTTPAPTASFVTPPPTRPDPLLQEPIPVLNTDEMVNLRDWAEGGPEALASPMTETGVNPVNLSTPRSASQEQQR